MKIIVFGSTGATGKEVVAQALAAGHDVTAFARTPSKVTMSHARLRVVQGDVLDAPSVDGAVGGHDAVVIALGTQLKTTDKTISLGTANIIDAMKRRGVERVIVESAWGTGDSRPHGGFFLNYIVRPFLLKHPFDEHELQEQSLAASNLAWTSVRPGRLTNGPKERTLRASRDPHGLSQRVSRADVAAFMLAEAETPAHVRQAILIG
jgi:putative NADH-flavin reductase